jgi:hypothetical protein
MADISHFEITAFQRRPGFWRASISRKDRAAITTEGRTPVRSVLTPMDCASEVDAKKAAIEAIKRL